MQFLKRLFGIHPRLASPLEVHPQLGPVRTAYQHSDGRVGPPLFLQARGDTDFRVALIELTADEYLPRIAPHDSSSAIDGLVAHTGDPFWRLARARWHINVGWKARGGGDASTVNDDGWRVLEERCHRAKADLEAAASQDPTDATPHVLMMTVARGLSARPLAEAAFRHASALAPTAYTPFERFRSSISARWFGSHDEMLAFVHQASRGAAPGSDLAGLILDAHHDVCSHKLAFDNDRAGAQAHLVSHHEALVHACARSIDAPGYRLTPWTMCLRHQAASMFWQVGDRQRAHAQLARVGNTFNQRSWVLGDADPEPLYHAVRGELGLS